MSRDTANRYEIPGQLQQLLLDFTVSCLVERPTDLVSFAAEYFAQLRQRQQQEDQTSGGLVAGSTAQGNGHGPESDDSMLTDESDEPSPGKILITILYLFFYPSAKVNCLFESLSYFKFFNKFYFSSNPILKITLNPT